MQKNSIFFILLISLLIVIFATQNANVVLVHLLFFKFNIPIALLIIGTLLLGVLLSWLFLAKELNKKQKKINKQLNEIKELKERQAFLDPLNLKL